MCALNMVKVQCVTVKLLIIMSNNGEVIKTFFIIKIINICQSNYFQNECCSITSRRAVMCALNMVKIQCVTVKLLRNFS